MKMTEVFEQRPAVTVSTKKIVMATGGSGGHIFPALLVGDELKKRGHGIYFVGTFGRWREIIVARGYPVHTVEARGLSTENIKSVLASSASMVKSTLDSIFYLKKCRPDAVVGFGGYGAFPAVAAAALLGIPTMIHEQNVWPGKANALLARWVSAIAISFEESRSFLRRKNIVWTGCPSRENSAPHPKNELFRMFGLKEGVQTVLIFGGSQGSRSINVLFVSAAERLRQKTDFQIIHLAGSESEVGRLKETYQGFGLAAFVCGFSHEMEKIYQMADVAVGRAGAVTVTELAAFKVPSIFIPYPHAQGHQKANAEVLADAGLASVVEEKDATPQRLEEEILKAFQGKFSLKAEAAQTIGRPGAAARVADEVLGLVRR